MRKKVSSTLKKILIIYGIILLALVVTCIIVYTSYNKKIKESAKESLLAAEKLTDLVPNNDLLKEASTEISKTINEAIEENLAIENNENIIEESQTINTEIQNLTIEKTRRGNRGK